MPSLTARPYFNRCPQRPLVALPATAQRALTLARQGQDRAWRGACGPEDKRGRSEGAPETIDAGRVTGERLAQRLLRCEAARVTSERSGVVTRAAIP